MSYNPEKNSVSCRKWYLKHKQEKYLYLKKRVEEWKQFKQSLGKCVICGGGNRTLLHERNGSRHPLNPAFFLARKDNLKVFIPLCDYHHRMIHFLRDYKGLTQELKSKIDTFW